MGQILEMPFTVYAAIERGDKAKITMGMLSRLSVMHGIDIDVLCSMCDRIPQDVFYKIVKHPELVQIVRDFEVGV